MHLARAFVLLTLPAIGACAWAGTPASSALGSAIRAPTYLPPVTTHRSPSSAPPAPLPGDIALAIETRLTELERLGGACSAYASVMKRSYREGRIAIRPYMWRVDGRLVSGQATANGDMILARDIDPLNVGLRTVDDVLWSVEHEAAHIAFRISNDEAAGQDSADRHVRGCRDAPR